MKEIWALVEISGDKVLRTSEEALCEAVRQGRQLRVKTTALVAGGPVRERMIEEIAAYGPDRLLVLEDDALSPYLPGAYACRLERLLRGQQPDVFLLGASAISREIAPRLACRLGCGLVTEATFLRPEGDGFVVTRPAFRPQASMLARFQTTGLQIISLAPRVVDVEKMGVRTPWAVEYVRQEPALRNDAITVEAITRELPSAIDLADAEVIVAGGRGMQSKENFRLLDDLADVLGGTVAATRMAVDMEWRPRERMVGISGRVVAPELYIACGISGAIQHVMGMRSSRNIVAINVDPRAPIFRIASLGIIGDATEVVPLMTEAFRQRKSEQLTRGGTTAVNACF